MQQPPNNSAVLVFLKSMATPIVLYTADSQKTYAEIKKSMVEAKTHPKLVEKETMGPLKHVFFWDTEIAGAALQMDPSGPQPSASNLPTNLPGSPPRPGSPIKPLSPSSPLMPKKP